MIMDKKDIVWSAQIEAPQTAVMVGDTLVIEGVAIPGPQKNLNNWAVDPSDYDSIVEQFNSGKIRLRKNHGDNIEDIIGAVVEGKRVGDQVRFKAEVDDKAIQQKILKGRVEYVSIAGRPANIRCNVCAKPTRPFRLCTCSKAHDIITGLRVKELSAVATPAYGESTDLHPITFVAAINKFLEDAAVIEDVDDDAAKVLLNQLDVERASVVNRFLGEYTGVKPSSMVKLLSQLIKSNPQAGAEESGEAVLKASLIATSTSSEVTKTKSENKMSAEIKPTEDPIKASENVIAAKMCEDHKKPMPCPECSKKASEESATSKLSAGPDAVILLGQALVSQTQVIEKLAKLLEARTDAGHGEGVPLPKDTVEDYKKWHKSKEDEEKKDKEAKKKEEEESKKMEDDKKAKKMKDDEEAKKKEEEEAGVKAAALRASTTVDNTNVDAINGQPKTAAGWQDELKAYARERLHWDVN